MTAIMCAAKFGSVSAIKQLIDMKASLELQDEVGWNALHLACSNNKTGYQERVQLVLDSAAIQMDEITYFKFINTQTNEENTPLMISLQSGSFDSAD